MLRPLFSSLVLAVTLVSAVPAAGAENPARQPPFGTEPLAELVKPRSLEAIPPGFELSARDAIDVADSTPEVEAEREQQPARATALIRGDDRWQISYFDADGTEVAQVVVAPDGEVLEAYRDHQVEVKLARGYEGAVGGETTEAWVWLPLCLLFIAPFFDPRRPLRLLHLDLLVLLSFGVSQFFFNRGEIVASVPLVYPVLAYLFVRLMLAGLRPSTRPGPLVPLIPIKVLAIGIVVLLGFRASLALSDPSVIDIGFAGVVGADRIVDGESIYDGEFTPMIDRGDSYGPFNYLAYVPFEQVFAWSGEAGDSLDGAKAAAISFDLLVVLALLLLGRRLREDREGTALGIALAFAWVAYPYSTYTLVSDANDALVAALALGALLAFSSPLGRGALIALGGAAKFGPLALAPLFAAGRGEDRLRSTMLFGAAFTVVWIVVLVPLLPSGGLGEFYDRTFGYQASRGSPFSVWGLAPALEPLQKLARAFPVVLGLALFLWPRRRSPVDVAALGGALLIATQVGSTHWFYFFIAWWTPYALVALFAGQQQITAAQVRRSSSPARPASAS